MMRAGRGVKGQAKSEDIYVPQSYMREMTPISFVINSEIPNARLRTSLRGYAF